MDAMEPSPIDSLKSHLAERGSMSVGDYMSWCLTGSAAAYYRSGNPIGAAGDFVTAPEVSQIFGELIAIWAYTVWQSMGMPRPFSLVELGPGRGTLMQDALRAAGTMPGFADAAQIHLVETSEALRDTQRQVLSPYCAPNWHRSVQAVPHEPLIVIANEFFDALPVEQHIFENGSWHRRVVVLNGKGHPAFSAGRLAVPPVELMPAEPPREGDILEHRPAAAALIAEFGRRAQTAPVAVLVADYGYERRDYGDTLQAVRAHGYANPLEAPGETDLSAHVNFAELAQAAETAGLNVWGPMPQSEFLLSLGLEARLRVLMSAAREDQRAALFLGARRLVDPFQMGNLFKVLAMTSGKLPPPAPFNARPALRS